MKEKLFALIPKKSTILRHFTSFTAIAAIGGILVNLGINSLFAGLVVGMFYNKIFVFISTKIKE